MSEDEWLFGMEPTFRKCYACRQSVLFDEDGYPEGARFSGTSCATSATPAPGTS